MRIRPAMLVASVLVGAAIGFVMWRDWIDGTTMLAVAVALWAGFSEDTEKKKTAA